MASGRSRSEVLECFASKTRDKAAALKFIKRATKRHGRPRAVVTDGRRSYPAAMDEIGNTDRQEVGRWINNRAENSHQPFRRRQRAMLRFRRMKTLQKFASVQHPLASSDDPVGVFRAVVFANTSRAVAAGKAKNFHHGAIGSHPLGSGRLSE